MYFYRKNWQWLIIMAVEVDSFQEMEAMLGEGEKLNN